MINQVNQSTKSLPPTSPSMSELDVSGKGVVSRFNAGFDSKCDVSAITELGMTKAIYDACSNSVHFLDDAGIWLVADNESGLWRRDLGDETVSGWFMQYLESGRLAAGRMVMNRDYSGPKLVSALHKLERQNPIQGGKTLLRSMPGVTVTQEKFDTDPYLTGLRGGMCLDLRTGQVRKMVPSDYITRTLGTAFDASARCPLFEKSMLQWCCGNVELVKFLQVWTGYCLSGLTEFQGLLFLYGGGRNGKSVFTSTMTQLMGDYAQMMPSECLMTRDNTVSNDIARLVGKRFVTAVELPENKRMDENKIKQLTGGERVAARALYKDFFEFKPVLKLTISGNHKPIIHGTDFGIWRRIHLIPFNAQILDADLDPDLTNKLAAELPGILNWAIEGFRIYQQEGLIIPQCVIEESRAYRSEMDIVGQWLEACTKQSAEEKVKAADLYSSFKGWAAANGFHQMNATSFGRAMSDRFDSKKTNAGKYYFGIALLNPPFGSYD